MGFRETEKSVWKKPENVSVIRRMIKHTIASVNGSIVQPLKYVHVLDLAADGLV